MRKPENRKSALGEDYQRQADARPCPQTSPWQIGGGLNKFALPPGNPGIQENWGTIASQARPIVLALENLLAHARLASHNPEGMLHLLFLYGLDKRFKIELEAMGAAERYFACDSMNPLNRQ